MTWDWAAHTDTWSDEQRQEYQRAYAAGEPVVWPHEGHDPGECDHCDTLRALQAVADADGTM